jgi:hypothetical protein
MVPLLLYPNESNPFCQCKERFSNGLKAHVMGFLRKVHVLYLGQAPEGEMSAVGPVQHKYTHPGISSRQCGAQNSTLFHWHLAYAAARRHFAVAVHILSPLPLAKARKLMRNYRRDLQTVRTHWTDEAPPEKIPLAGSEQAAPCAWPQAAKHGPLKITSGAQRIHPFHKPLRHDESVL